MNAVSPEIPVPSRPVLESRPSVAVWPWPIALGVLTAFGLLSALLGQHGVWLALSWAALSIPLIVTLACPIRAWRRTSSVKGGQS
ncbi:hypothetical protein LU298_12275 [Komagataeibacter intermedius]|uniref:Uncharacterized protein n=2 Tax=Komagataeibacter intermedius TaxID=66229 RepID=A0A0N1FK59_9PROT|nr:hypothetical protein [Komagataeibacter intermedius]KPH86260.1 hypothetical protein GLUCOINTEAF2_0202875 [Komagataeibacter intermedius AF2]MCF3637270.1 hypothetical protein [Komagataeibacter intermedius]GAN87288.1 hypothetical protein Gain_0056_006 [Komagataeibacter intermedius TF2]GBQ72681.1 hypothetical protein AA0521_2171 [Komagataeibacter intermedius NRIC 0521]